MSLNYKDYTLSVKFDGCRSEKRYSEQIELLILAMEKNKAPYAGFCKLTVIRDGDQITTKKKNTEGLDAECMKILDGLEVIAHDICKKGGDPGKVKTEVGVEKEI